MSESDKKHRKEVEERVEEVKKSLSLKAFSNAMHSTTVLDHDLGRMLMADIDFRGHEQIYSESGGVMSYEEDRSHPKRRRPHLLEGRELYPHDWLSAE
ncbi:hypothetical protein U1Q18_036003 [Sarracenia purpurea var. burkii]